MVDGSSIRFADEVAGARRDGRPVVALESSVLAQGLPVPANRDADARMRSAVRRHGAVPAVTAVVRGVPTVGLEGDDLERFLMHMGVSKVSARDMPWAVASGIDGGTTVAAALCLCALAGLDVFATGGIGGVHRNAPFDESADLLELSRTPAIVVCAGAKSVLDLPATFERLETLGVSVLGYRTAEFPGFFAAATGLRLTATAEHPEEVVATFRAMRALKRPGALLVVQSPPVGAALDESLVHGAVDAALVRAAAGGISGAAVTPFLLAAVDSATGGRSLATNLALLEANASLAATIAVALSVSL